LGWGGGITGGVTYRSQGREGGEDGGVVHFGGCDLSPRGVCGLVVETDLFCLERCVL
jgi:hypothetical protein